MQEIATANEEAIRAWDGEILRLAGERAAHMHEQVRAALRQSLAEYLTTDGVMAPASTWIVTADAPS